MNSYSTSRCTIIATLGPASRTVEGVRSLIRAGATCFRLNFSHARGDEMKTVIEAVREAERLENTVVAILGDVQGPKLRVGAMPTEGVTLREGEPFLITQRPVPGTETQVHSPYEFLAKDVRVGARILLADGTIELEVVAVEGVDVHCRVQVGGRLYSNKGMNLPGVPLSVETLTDKDRQDLAFIADADVDLVAISFVRTADDVRAARACLKGKKKAVIAKLERPEALQNLEDILAEADGVMVARGDLGVEVPFERVPTVQRHVLQRATQRAKWAVVATQMLGSMVLNRRPSRAEVTDVATAVSDGADAIMLSEETATGLHPHEAVGAMTRIAREAESQLPSDDGGPDAKLGSFEAGAAGAAVGAARTLGAKALVALAGSSLTALLLSKWRPSLPILALSKNPSTLRRLACLRGTFSLALTEETSIPEQLARADGYLRSQGWAKDGDIVVVVASGMGMGPEVGTTAVLFHRVGASAKAS